MMLYSQQTILAGTFFLEIRGKTSSSHDEHDDILDDGNIGLCPEGIGIRKGERQVALEHVNSILLEGEDG